MTQEMQFKSTVDVKLIQAMGGDHMVVAAAKVSTSQKRPSKSVIHYGRLNLPLVLASSASPKAGR